MRKIGIKYGLLTGIAVISYLLVFYFFDKNSVRSLLATWSSMLIYLVGMAMAVLAVRRSQREDMSLSMIQVAFMVWLIANAFYYMFFYGIMMYDNELLEMHQQMTHNDMLEFYKDRADYLTDIKKNQLTDYTPTIRGSLFQYVKGAIGGFILSVIVAEIVKRGTKE